MTEVVCRCGAVQGTLAHVAPRNVNRAICYCDDCQAFAHWLGRGDLLDAHGGTDIVQVAPGTLRFARGQAHITGVRLSPKGLFRWYASCCNTPLGNTVGPVIPFVGVVSQAIRVGDQDLDLLFGAPRVRIMAAFAVGDPPGASRKVGASAMLSAIGTVLSWRLKGWAWPNPYFDRATRAPVYPVNVLSREEREALRPQCGPHPVGTGPARGA